MVYVDPTHIRVSEHFLLSDFMGCDAVYRGRCANRMFVTEEDKLEEVFHLAETVLEPLVEEHGSISISYGYISPDLSREIVKYQDPNKPSYHRWDLGAAADVLVHNWINDDKPPARLAVEIERNCEEYARMITYSESPYICLATSLTERNRRAMYENRYDGKKGVKPTFITYSKNKESRAKQLNMTVKADLDNWQGHGYPTYHGGGRQQTQHIRISEYSMLSDYLYSKNATHKGLYNIPELDTDRGILAMTNIRRAGEYYDNLAERFNRCSIIRAFESDLVDPKGKRGFTKGWTLNVVPPAGIELQELASYTKMKGIDCKVQRKSVLVWEEV